MTAENMIRVMVVDDHPVVRRGIALLLSTEPDLELVAEAENGRQAIQQFRAHRPDVTLMDLRMPEMGGVDSLTAIRAEFPEARFVVLTTYAGDVEALRAMQAGARAYMLKTAPDRELLDTVRSVHAGKKFVSPGVSYELAEHVADDRLTETEVRVLRLIAQGKANKEIAKALSTSEATVKWQVRTILSKLGVQDRTHAAMIGVKRGIIEL
ncbi:MAG TPA: response regulator transcription factor [Steroidobacteraceae bacterium]|nr:response regulator transcription factor [Steroidobacteraceae bacterium]